VAQSASRPFDVRGFPQADSRRRPTPAPPRGRRKPAAARARPPQHRTYLLLPRAEARCLALAFYRFVELHGRALSWPPDACSLEAVPCPAGETVMLGLWSPRAADEFDRFWTRYRLFFSGPPPMRGRAFRGLAAFV